MLRTSTSSFTFYNDVSSQGFKIRYFCNSGITNASIVNAIAGSNIVAGKVSSGHTTIVKPGYLEKINRVILNKVLDIALTSQVRENLKQNEMVSIRYNQICCIDADVCISVP